MDKEDARKEYVLNDVGKIFVGTQKEPRGRRWIYGQVKLQISCVHIFSWYIHFSKVIDLCHKSYWNFWAFSERRIGTEYFNCVTLKQITKVWFFKNKIIHLTVHECMFLNFILLENFVEDSILCWEYKLQRFGCFLRLLKNIVWQFADSVLPGAMLMLNHSKLDYTGRASPILVSRAISKLVSYQKTTN